MTSSRDLPRCLAILALQGLLCPVAGLSVPVGCWLLLATLPFRLGRGHLGDRRGVAA